MIEPADFDRLHAAALAVRNHAHAPYSRFLVGAAVLLEDGEVIAAANMENASYGLSLCAEALALGAVTARGSLAEVAAVVVTGGPADAPLDRAGEAITPCGRCRQLLAEAAGRSARDLPVIATDLTGTVRVARSVSGWLPDSFRL